VHMQATDLNTLVGATLKGEYKKRGLRLEDLAPTVGIPYGTLRRKIAGESPIFASELVLLCQAIGVTPERVLADAIDLFGGTDKLMSEASSISELSEKERMQEEARAMSTEQIEGLTNHAGTSKEANRQK
jgi:transcriptional regulator with XRE-family HTH domain